ncbi:sugar ABC transporter permease [Bosea sp. (in: a-proteobacteria)]|uniref:Carbohydrate ABC transporter permease n=1 Tax=Bosea vestrisii TaxID=151416 RepID=A0ABW0H627_9HYPH|nr:sugar ABC transporter permease [Bosea sp. (in: a-proteobacteria)]MBA4220486.1 sugar ABC transporter permease [Methylobacterium sp.]MBR3189379.1 sugar ABC transporter permease [Bosea sp. (in: a-proteobacteria)]
MATVNLRRSYRWMAIPALAFAAAMIVYPFGFAVWLALADVQLGQDPKFAGLANFRKMFADGEFWNGLRLTFFLYVVSLAAQLVLGTWLGLLLARSQWARGIVRPILISPFMLPPVVVGMMAIVILDPSFGIANWLLEKIGLPPGLWLSDPATVMWTVAGLDTWQWTPFVALIVMGGYLALPTDVYDAAEIDGATSWQRLRYITLPLLAPTLITAAVLRSVDILRFFDIIYLTTQGGPGISSTTLNILAYRRGFEFFELGYASAVMVTLATIVLGTVLVFARLRRAVAW